MENTSYIILSDQMGLRRQMDIIANNIANSETPAYKGEYLRFAHRVASTDSGEPLTFAEASEMQRDFSEGALMLTGNPLDLAIRGNGFFAVETDNGVLYTRNGRFTLNNDGEIVDSRGNRLLWEQGTSVRLPDRARNITIAQDGTVETDSGRIGRLRLVTFPDNNRLARVGNSYYFANGMTPTDAEDAEIVQGALERSNVSPVLQITRMISVLRSYQSLSQFVSAENDRQLQAIRTITREA